MKKLLNLEMMKTNLEKELSIAQEKWEEEHNYTREVVSEEMLQMLFL